eukprot:TRINITY_DN1817_c0_g1_i1.p1 TRINITY_DN1817_c0_g1~~TRINITY_DN1817_c0_g1_i1.p1  ORF type:complete len:215 (-),score=54.74 TRINITY_DN1817_c0_g1_i1:85-696(-)
MDENAETKKQRYNYSVICRCNMNRSMAAHALLLKNKYECTSYGTGLKVNVFKGHSYKFGYRYYDMIENIRNDENFPVHSLDLYVAMLERNDHCKLSPQRFLDAKDQFDVIVSYQTNMVFQPIVERFISHSKGTHPVHVIDIDTPDQMEDADIAAGYTLELVQRLEEIPRNELDDKIEDLLNEMQNKWDYPIHYARCFQEIVPQ